jgi:hypothetical protein
MNPEQIVLMLRSALAENRLLERLFFASLELVVLVLVVLLLVRLARIRSPRLVHLLWLVVLIKPIVSLAVGSPVTIGLLDTSPPQPDELVQSPVVTVEPSREPAHYGWASGAWDRRPTELPSEATSWPMSEPPQSWPACSSSSSGTCGYACGYRELCGLAGRRGSVCFPGTVRSLASLA